MTDRPILFSAPMVRALLEGRKTQTRRVIADGNTGVAPTKSSRFCIGDRLWVREAWRVTKALDGVAPRDLDQTIIPEWLATDPELYKGRKRASMHQPRWASRITLHVTDVRMQRLQDISEEDAIAEGIERLPDIAGMPAWLNYPDGSPAGGWLDPRESFRTLWNSINAARGVGWDTNPFVVAVSFTVERANISLAGV